MSKELIGISIVFAYVIGSVLAYIILKLMRRYYEKNEGYQGEPDAVEEYGTGITVLFSWVGILCILIIFIVSIIKSLIDKYIFKEDDN